LASPRFAFLFYHIQNTAKKYLSGAGLTPFLKKGKDLPQKSRGEQAALTFHKLM